MSIGRFNPAACNNNLEIAPALANLNFDFSLYKVEAPKEFIAVGSHLSTMRKEKAENGEAHATARSLGALFEEILPPVPTLMRCYGQRASEISQVTSLTPEMRKEFRMFSDQVGADATSIWAAATSGSAAIAVHLLACLLARMFDGAEATSIWVELIHRRKEEIETRFNETNSIHMSTLQATRQIIGRNQLAEWDASARAWLRIADQAKRLQHTQLKLVLDNIDLRVNKIPETYNSVVDAWISCLTKADALLKGLSQQASQGDILLATSAWHLYPDMEVVSPSQAHITQHDPLFQNQAILTVGLEQTRNSGGGVSWSLPLKYLRYYGAPVKLDSNMNSLERSRLSLDEFKFVVLGCLIAKDSAAAGVQTVIQGYAAIYNLIRRECIAGSVEAQTLIEGPAADSWLNLVFGAAQKYLDIDGNERMIADKLIALGRRHEQEFLGVPSDPLFGIFSDGSYVCTLANTDERIRHLRNVALDHFDDQIFFLVLILYLDGSSWKLTTIVPIPTDPEKRNSDGVSMTMHKDYRTWTFGDDFQQRPLGSEGGQFDIDWYDFESDSFMSQYGRAIPRVYEKYQFLYGDVNSAALFVARSKSNSLLPRSYQAKALYRSLLTQKYDSAALVFHTALRLSHGFDDMTFNLLGNNEDFYDILQGEGHIRTCPFHHRMRGIATLVKLCQSLVTATIHIQILAQPLEQAKWLPKFHGHFPFKHSLWARVPKDASQVILPLQIDRQSAFACLTMFETGRYNAEPDRMDAVMAVSHEDSLFISAVLLGDPQTVDIESNIIVRVSGNIGRRGVSFLVPPQDPMTHKVSISDWPSLGELDFDGNIYDAFSQSSLHLSFTGAEAPIFFDFSGARDEDAQTIETVISLHDRGKWIADLNPWKAFNNPCLTKLHLCNDNYLHGSHEVPENSIIAVDGWLQLLDENMGGRFRLMQTKGNSEARFAAVCVSIALGLSTMVLPEDPCWRCVETKIRQDQLWTLGPQCPVFIG